MKPAVDAISIDGSIGSLDEFHEPAQSTTRNEAGERSRFAAFVEITKPRMNVMVVTTTLFGFLVASAGNVHWQLLLWTTIGTFLSASSASVFNQLIERRHDARMPRTRNRPLVVSQIRPAEAIAFGLSMAIVGLWLLDRLVNPLTAALSLITIVWYLALYTPSKRFTTLNTVIGAVPGAIPPMMGIAAATGHLSPAAVALFGILFVWQIPHFLAIAILYRDDYAAGGFKMLPIDDPRLAITRRQIVLYCLALIPTSLMPTFLGTAGNAYAVAAVLLGLMFLAFGIQCAMHAAPGPSERVNARRLFFASIIYLPLLLAALALNRT